MLHPTVTVHHGSERDPDGDDGGEGVPMSRRHTMTRRALSAISGFLVIPAGVAGGFLVATAAPAPAAAANSCAAHLTALAASTASPTPNPSAATPPATPPAPSPRAPPPPRPCPSHPVPPAAQPVPLADPPAALAEPQPEPQPKPNPLVTLALGEAVHNRSGRVDPHTGGRASALCGLGLAGWPLERHSEDHHH